MVPELQGFVFQFRASHGVFHRSLEGLTDAQAREVEAGRNPITWIAAHTVKVRGDFLRAFGGEADVPWGPQFNRGSELAAVTYWPTLAELRAKWDEIHPAFLARLEAMTSEQLASETKIPGLDKTLLGAVALAAFHDAYHVGQLGAARRIFSLSRVVG